MFADLKGPKMKYKLHYQSCLDPDSEIIWVKVDIPGFKNTYVCAYYKPKDCDKKSFDELRSFLAKISNSCLFVILTYPKLIGIVQLYSYPTSFGQVPVLVIFVLKCLLLKNFNLFLHLKKCLSILE